MSLDQASFDRQYQKYAQRIEAFLEELVKNYRGSDEKGIDQLGDAMAYSLMSGGKRFRPVLSLAVAEMINPKSFSFGIPFAVAIEFIHTYSLIHDDLPAMDNDDFRRGRPTNHIQFGEATALLAGDALLTESFLLIANHYSKDILSELVSLVSYSSGYRGMVGGQAIDLYPEPPQTYPQLIRLHELKTARLIQAAALGGAIASGADEKQKNQINRYALDLGIAFQLTDDILDFDSQNPEQGSFPQVIGIEETIKERSSRSQSARNQIQDWGERALFLMQMVDFNEQRQR